MRTLRIVLASLLCLSVLVHAGSPAAAKKKCRSSVQPAEAVNDPTVTGPTAFLLLQAAFRSWRLAALASVALAAGLSTLPVATVRTIQSVPVNVPGIDKPVIVVTGEGNYDLKQMSQDVAKIAEEGYKIFGEFPFEDYTFIVNLRGGGHSLIAAHPAKGWRRSTAMPPPPRPPCAPRRRLCACMVSPRNRCRPFSMTVRCSRH